MPPGTRSEFLELLSRISKDEASIDWTPKDRELSGYAIRIVLAEIDDEEMLARIGLYRHEIEATHEKLTGSRPE